ncbi:hypothetical protein [Streptomyces sp. NPDC056169]
MKSDTHSASATRSDNAFSLMWKNVANPPVTGPTNVDKANYKKIWG